MKSPSKFLFKGAAFLLFLILFGLLQSYLFGRNLIFEHRLPKNNLVLKIYQDGRRFNFLSLEDRFSMKISLEGASSGYKMDIAVFSADESNMDEYFSACSYTQDEHGIKFQQPNGYSIFIPEDLYSGGR